MKPNPRLKNFIHPYSKEVQDLTLELRNFITNLIPQANELIWDNYNAVAMAYSKSEKLKDAFCDISIYSKHVNFGFNRGAELTKSKLQLNGKGKLIRHISIIDFESFPTKKVTDLIWEAVSISERLNPELSDENQVGKSLVMSVSEKKIRPDSKKGK